MVNPVMVSLGITVIALAIAYVAFSAALFRAIRNSQSKGISDFRLHMSIVALVWLAGETVSLFASAEVGDTAHFISMILFVGFVLVRTGLLVERGFG